MNLLRRCSAVGFHSSAWKIATDAAMPCFNQSNLPLGRLLLMQWSALIAANPFVWLPGLLGQRPGEWYGGGGGGESPGNCNHSLWLQTCTKPLKTLVSVQVHHCKVHLIPLPKSSSYTCQVKPTFFLRVYIVSYSAVSHLVISATLAIVWGFERFGETITEGTYLCLLFTLQKFLSWSKIQYDASAD